MSARGGGGSLISVSTEIREKGNRCLRAFPKKNNNNNKYKKGIGKGYLEIIDAGMCSHMTN
jgi:hypothetical protein